MIQSKIPKHPPQQDYFVQLKTTCPTMGCQHRQEVISWAHAGCGAHTELNSQGMLRCSKHTEVVDSILKWRFACRHHVNEFLPVDPIALAQAITVLRSQSENVEDRFWYRRLVKSISKLMQEELDEMDDDEGEYLAEYQEPYQEPVYLNFREDLAPLPQT